MQFLFPPTDLSIRFDDTHNDILNGIWHLTLSPHIVVTYIVPYAKQVEGYWSDTTMIEHKEERNLSFKPGPSSE